MALRIRPRNIKDSKRKFHVKIAQVLYATEVKPIDKTRREMKTGLKSVRKGATNRVYFAREISREQLKQKRERGKVFKRYLHQPTNSRDIRWARKKIT